MRGWLRRHALLLRGIGLGLSVVALIVASLADFVRTAIARDEQVQEITLKGELARFLLATTQEDGSSLLENPQDFASAIRVMRPVQLQRPFFTYFLTTGNGRTVSASTITWEPPRACAVDFVDDGTKDAAKSLRACFGVVPNDPSGRFIYFAFRYATGGIVRHKAGEPVARSSSIVLALRGDIAPAIRLMLEQPKYVTARYPSQLRRFNGIHELTAYALDRAGVPLRGVQGQAYERRIDAADGSSVNTVTIVGRIDAGMVFNTSESLQTWSSGRYRALAASVQVYEVDNATGVAQPHIQVPFDAKGTALHSLEQAYLTSVPSRAVLDVYGWAATNQPAGTVLWTSTSLTTRERSPPGLFQRISNFWAGLLVRQFELRARNTPVVLASQIRGISKLRLTAEPTLLPELATRAFLGLSAALLAVLALGVSGLFAYRRMRIIAEEAVRSAKKPTIGDDMRAYSARDDEIGMLGRTFSVLIRRYRSRNETISRNAKWAERRREERARLQEEQVKARHDVLRAIGHEIKSPLQSLLNRAGEDPDLLHELEKMRRAVDALYFASTVEAGLKQRSLVIKLRDLAAFMARLCDNYSSEEAPVVYHGPTQGVFVPFDHFALDEVFSRILDNAKRHMAPATVVSVEMRDTEEVIAITVHNVGASIPDTDLDQVFDFKFTTQTNSAQNMGLGLFAARIYVLGMRGFIAAANASDGVTFTVNLPRRPPQG